MTVHATTPTRISLFGGGTDTPAYANRWGGLTLSISINLRQHLTVTDTKGKWSLPEGANPDFYQAFLKAAELPQATIKQHCDASIHSGLGSSASAAVALVGAINKLQGSQMTLSDVAETAWETETELGLFGGRQDQYAAAYGGVNVFEFTLDGVTVTPLSKAYIDPLLPYLLLVDTGLRRTSPSIQDGLKQPSPDQMAALDRLKEHAVTAITLLANQQVEAVGRLLHQTWEFKKKSNKVTTKEINKLYDLAQKNGALGGKLLGSGGGGYMLFIVPPLKRTDVIWSLTKQGCKEIDFGVDWNGLEVLRVCER